MSDDTKAESGAELLQQALEHMRKRGGELPAGTVTFGDLEKLYGPRAPIMAVLAAALDMPIAPDGEWVPTDGLEEAAERASGGDQSLDERVLEERILAARRAVALAVGPALGGATARAMLALEESPTMEEHERGGDARERMKALHSEVGREMDTLDALQLQVVMSFAASLQNMGHMLTTQLVGTLLRRHPYTHGLLLQLAHDDSHPAGGLVRTCTSAYGASLMLSRLEDEDDEAPEGTPGRHIPRPSVGPFGAQAPTIES